MLVYCCVRTNFSLVSVSLPVADLARPIREFQFHLSSLCKVVETSFRQASLKSISFLTTMSAHGTWLNLDGSLYGDWGRLPNESVMEFSEDAGRYHDRRLDTIVSPLSPPEEQSGRSNFTTSRHDQAQSRLASLAREIRLKILRYLLKADDGCIKSLDEVVRTYAQTTSDSYMQAFPGSAQILRACQILLQDGRAVLYKENSVSMYWWVPSDSMAKFENKVHGRPPHASTHVEYSHLNCSVLNTTLSAVADKDPSAKIKKLLQDHDQLYTPEMLAKYLSCYSNFVRRFDRIVLTIESMRGSSVHLFVMCRMLRGILPDKHVTVVFKQPELLQHRSRKHSPSVDKEGTLHLDDLFCHPFEYLSCSDISFHGCVVPQETIDDIRSTPTDTYELYYTFKTRFLDELPYGGDDETGGFQHDDRHFKDLSNVFCATLGYNQGDLRKDE